MIPAEAVEAAAKAAFASAWRGCAWPGDTQEQNAVYTLAVLMDRYNVAKTSTYVKAAQLIVDAYPELIPVLGESERAA